MQYHEFAQWMARTFPEPVDRLHPERVSGLGISEVHERGITWIARLHTTREWLLVDHRLTKARLSMPGVTWDDVCDVVDDGTWEVAWQFDDIPLPPTAAW